jgi:hypothetical protein
MSFRGSVLLPRERQLLLGKLADGAQEIEAGAAVGACRLPHQALIDERGQEVEGRGG